MYSRIFVLLGILCFTVSRVFAGTEPTKVLSADIQKAHRSGVNFQSFQLFTNITGEKHAVLTSETLLSPNTSVINSVYENYPKAVSFDFTTAEGTVYTLELMRSTPLAYNADLGYIDATGRHTFAPEKAAHYQGAVKGSEQSFAAVSIFGNGDVMILFGNEEGNFVIGKLEDNTGRYIFYNDRNMTVKPAACGVEELPMSPLKQISNGSNDKTTTAYNSCNKVSMYWEADFATYKSRLSSVTATQSYMTGLFNEVQTLYRNEKIPVELKSVSIWTVADGYDSTTSSAGLNAFKNRWNAKGDTFNAHVAMLLAKDPGGNGGVAFLDVLCSKSSAYAYADVDVSFNTVPTYSWDVEMVTHEHGHNLGSPHTHWCGWMTGSGGTCGSIDDCTTKQGSTGCSNCTYEQYQNSQPTSAWQGTIMSYCHLVARGTNLANGFGPLPGNLIRDNIKNATSCLSSIISATLAPKFICKNDGAVTLTYDANLIGSSNFAPGPYKYSWSNGATTQNLSGLSKPSTYILDITDSLGCKMTYYVVVSADKSAGCWPESVTNTQMHDTYISVYPNPAHSSVSIKYFTAGKGTNALKITDVMGRVIYTQDINATIGENTITIPTEGWAKGIYQIQLNTEGTRYTTTKLAVE